LAVIGTGVDQQVIITDELMRGERVRKALGGRMKRAFSVIFVSVATTMAAMAALAILGFGVFRGFAIITIAGLLAAVLVTRPAYARIASAILG
jgi:preprotein translocase subunit SecD